MNKISKVRLVLFIATLMVVVISPLPIQAIIRQLPQQSLIEINSKYLALSWGDIWNALRRRKVAGGSRGDLVCMLSPGASGSLDSKQEIWSDRPLFVWYIEKGKVQNIELFSQGSEQSLWSREIKEGETKVVYDGEPLQLGQAYQWRLSILDKFPAKSISFQFQLMEAERRNQITDDLVILEEELKKQGVNPEKIALEKANYFINRELWSDALQEIYSVPNPSSELSEILQEIPLSDYCTKD